MSDEKKARLTSKFIDAISEAIDVFLDEHLDHIQRAVQPEKTTIGVCAQDTANAVLKALCGNGDTLADRLPSLTPVQRRVTIEWANLLHDTLTDMLPTIPQYADPGVWTSGD